MKKWLVIAALIPVTGFVITHGSNHSIAGNLVQAVFEILLCLLLLGIPYGFFLFHRWHRAFHTRMKTQGVWSRNAQ